MAAQQALRDKKCDAFIIAHVNSQGEVEYLVRPSACVIDGRQDPPPFRIRNLTGQAQVFVDLLGSGNPAGPQQVGAGKHDYQEFAVTTADYSFEYEVTVNGTRARGESDPVIIIDPPGN